MFQALDEVPDIRRDPKGAYNALLSIIDIYLDIIAAEGREPDAWESLDLVGALDSLRQTELLGAQAYIERAITPPDNQSKDYHLSPDQIESVASVTLQSLRYQVSVRHAKGYMASC
jgi:hypothetical protein